MSDNTSFFILLGVLVVISGILFLVMASMRGLLTDTRKVMASMVKMMEQVAVQFSAANATTNRLIENNISEMRHYFELLDAKAGYPPPKD